MPSSLCSQCGANVTSRHPPQPQGTLDAASPGTRPYILLNSNEAPLESDVPVITSALRSLDERLVHLDDEILRLRQQLERLEEERAAVSSRRSQTQRILSALRRIPPEILGYIFSLTLPIPRKARRTVVPVKESPWTLSHVSRYWRAVALSESSLWSLVTLDYEDPAPFYPLSMVETQIARAKRLKIHFYGFEKLHPQPQTEMFQFLAQHAVQWEELSLRVTSHIAPLLSTLRDRLPLLRRFYLLWEPEDEPAIDRVECFQNAPLLVGACISDFPPIAVLFPAHNLTQYQCHASSWGTHVEILRQTPNLVDTRLTVDAIENWPDGQEIIDLTCLRRLLVSHAELLHFLRLPVLEELTIDCEETEGPNILGALRSAVSRSSCVLRRLCFWGLPVLTSTSDILGQFTSILAFAVIISRPHDSDLAQTLMRHLTITATGASGAVAPQLRDISFACDEGGYLVHRLYLDMIESRCRAGGFQTSKLLVGSGVRPDPLELHDMEMLRQGGLVLDYLEGVDADDAITAWTFEPQWI
ncbi:hypothetical protein C8R46DRAFT_1116605 [Mycena filopes]|nr:hypothetical protein C8R46DRAFT_1116605 [Mycena filopes]